MKAGLKRFQVDISNLNGKNNEFSFEIGDDFFEALEQELVERGDVIVDITLKKSSVMIQADFDVRGEIELICDRSLRPFMYPLDCVSTIYFKFSDKNEELSDDVTLITADTSYLNLANYIFDFIALQIPIKKIHPDLITEKDQEEGDILIYSSINNENELTDNDIDILDPRWEALKKLKDTF